MPLTLVVVQGRRAQEVYTFGSDRPVLIGSSPQAHVRLSDRGVAGIHARLAPLHNGAWEVLAAPGLSVLVNSAPTPRANLKVGDRLEVGDAALAISACTRSATDRLPQQPPAPALARGDDALPAAVHFLNGPSKGRIVPLGGQTTLGRAPTADIPLLDGRCSRVHARIERTSRGYVLLDMGSTNGTRLNGQPMAPATSRPLETGDWIQTGSTVLEFHLGPDAARLRETNHGPEEDELPPDALARQAPTDKMTTQPAPRTIGPVLSGDLRRMQFADVVQFLSMARKTGDLTIQHPSGEWRLSFHEGNAVHARGPQAWPSMQTFQAMARLDQGRFEFTEGTPPEEVTLRTSTQALLLEALRLVDEQTDIQGILS